MENLIKPLTRQVKLDASCRVEAPDSLLAMLGANKKNRVFTSSAEADKFLSELRNE